MLNQAMTYLLLCIAEENCENMCKSIGSLKGDQNIPILSKNQNYCKVEWDLHQCAESEKWKLFLSEQTSAIWGESCGVLVWEFFLQLL